MATFEEARQRINGGAAAPADLVRVSWDLLYGDGVERDIAGGIDLLKKASEMGSPEAQVRLARLFEVGECVDQDCEVARIYYEMANSTGTFYGPYALGLSNYFGSPCAPQDFGAALEHFQEAARRGHLVSAAQAARLMRSGRFGWSRRLLGVVLMGRTLLQSWYLLLRNRPTDRFWDAERWFPNSKMVERMRKGTRFE